MGNVITKGRERLNWNQSTLARAAGVNQSAVCLAEYGKGLSVPASKRLAVVLRTRAEVLHEAGNAAKPSRRAAVARIGGVV